MHTKISALNRLPILPRERSLAIVIPVCNEADALEMVLPDMVLLAKEEGLKVAVGVNGSSDESAEIARRHGVFVKETRHRGYGWGCMAGIQVLAENGEMPEGYLFAAGDGANSVEDIRRLLKEWRAGNADLILGERTLSFQNWRSFGARRALPNLTLGALCSLLTGQRFLDLGALRIVSRWIYEAAPPEELTWGWTAEAQILAARMGARIRRLQVKELPRIAGDQKVSGVSWRRSLSIGIFIASACWRVRLREIVPKNPALERGARWPHTLAATQGSSIH